MHFWQIHNFCESSSCDRSFFSSIWKWNTVCSAERIVNCLLQKTQTHTHCSRWQMLWSVSVDTKTNTKLCKVQQLTDSRYQELQHHLLILTDCYREYQIQSTLQLQQRVSRTVIIVLLQLSVATAIIILSAHFNFNLWTVQFTASIVLSNCFQLYVSTDTVILTHCQLLTL
jgi:hypothetical protein